MSDKGQTKGNSIPLEDRRSIDRSSNPLSLDDIIDLTVVELYILNFLVRIGGSAVRFGVFNELNAKLEKNKVSRSSFYHSLKKLEKKEFVLIHNNPKGKGSLVSATQLAREAVKQSNIFSIWGNIDLNEISLSVIKKLKIELDKNAHSQLVVTMDEVINTTVLDKMSVLVDNMSILGDAEVSEILTSRNFNFPITKIVDGCIESPDEPYDRGIIINFHPSVEKFGINAVSLLKEVIRVIKHNGQIIVIAYDEFPRTNNLILDSVMNDLLEEVIHSHINKKNLLHLMKDMNIENIILHNLKGSIIAIGRKK